MPVDLDPLIAAVMREKDIRRSDGKAVGGIGGGVDADELHVLQRVDVLQIAPCDAIENQEQFLGDRPQNPAGARRGEAPGAVETEGDLALMRRPCPARTRRDQIAIAVAWRWRGR